MGRERGWVSINVQTYQSHRNSGSSSRQQIVSQEYTVEEAGAVLNAVPRSSDQREEERLAAQVAAQSSSGATTSILIRDRMVRALPAPAALHTHPSPRKRNSPFAPFSLQAPSRPTRSQNPTQ